MIEIIPAIDIIGGKCVRLTQGDYNQKKIYNENPLEVAKEFEAAGIRRLHLVDLDGAKARHVVNHKILKSIATQTDLVIDFGGGVKTDEDIQLAFDSGASQVTAGTIAVKNKSLFLSWIERYTAQKLILGADVLDNKIAIQGWQSQTDVYLFAFLDYYLAQGVEYVVCTDISKDGMMEGSSMELYKNIRTHYPNLKLIASGGISSIAEIEQLNEIGVHGAIIGKAIYEGSIQLKDLRSFL